MPQNQLSNRPIYRQLRDALAQRIANGEWKPGQAIPNEGELAREFGVSPGTMRKALGLLEEERLITRRQGRGTFVNDQASEELADRYFNVRGADGRSIPGRVEVMGLTEAIANEAERGRLELPGEHPVWRLRRVRFHRDQPFMYEELSLPAELFPRLDEKVDNRIVVLAQQHGLLLGTAQERISIATASRAAQDALSIATGSPVIMLDRVVRTIDGAPVEWRVAQCDFTDNYYLAHLH
jgi:GntR family transcriptional regulator